MRRKIFIKSDEIKKLKEKYPEGTEIKLIKMSDPYLVPSGTYGVVDFVDDAGTIFMNWENGSSLGLIEGVDKFEIVEKTKIKKPKAPIIGADGNVFNLIAICSRELKKAGYSKQATEMTNRVIKAKSYDDALAIMFDYIEPVDSKGKSFEETDFFDEDIYI
jgi:hypothetical protein